MSTHNICFRGEIRKCQSIRFRVKQKKKKKKKNALNIWNRDWNLSIYEKAKARTSVCIRVFRSRFLQSVDSAISYPHPLQANNKDSARTMQADL